MRWICPYCGEPTLIGIETETHEWCECITCGYKEPPVRRDYNYE